MNGGLAHVGRVGVTIAIRSCTCCLASRRSVPRLKIISIEDSCSTDLDLMTASPGTPLSVCSRGTVTSDSTWAAESPREGVWISTFGGANSGKTSTLVCWSCWTPKKIRPPATAMMMYRNLRLDPTTQRSIRRFLSRLVVYPGFGPVQLGHPYRHDGCPRRRAFRQEDLVSFFMLDRDLVSEVHEGFGIRVHPEGALGIDYHSAEGNDEPLALHLDRSRLEVDSLRCAFRERDPRDRRLLDLLHGGRRLRYDVFLRHRLTAR